MLSQTEYMDLLTTLAPIQSDGSKDRNEWNLFHAYVSSESQDLRNVHGLSDMLQLFVEHTVSFFWTFHQSWVRVLEQH